MELEELEQATPQVRREWAKTLIAAAPDREKREVASTAVAALAPEIRSDLITEEIRSAPAATKKNVAAEAVKAAHGADKKEVAAAAVSALSAKQQAELLKSMWPTDSKDKLKLYITGFIVAGVVALGLGLIAWGAARSGTNVAEGILVLATGFSSAILGGLLGAYVQRS